MLIQSEDFTKITLDKTLPVDRVHRRVQVPVARTAATRRARSRSAAVERRLLRPAAARVAAVELVGERARLLELVELLLEARAAREALTQSIIPLECEYWT